MKNKITSLVLLLASFFIHFGTYSQSKKVYTSLLNEDFNTNENKWKIEVFPQYKTFISRQKYICSHPLTNLKYDFTRIPVSNVLNLINQAENTELNFSFEILETQSDGYFSFGLVFDRHDNTDICAENEENVGDFYLIQIQGNSNSAKITANINQREKCQFKEIIKPVRDAKYNKASKNLISISKNNSTYDVIINGTVVTSFVYDAKCNFTDLYFHRGSYAFDDIKINKISYDFSSQNGFEQSNTSNEKPKIYVLLAGISNYNNPNYSIGQLKGPLKDITAMKSFYNSISGGAIKNTDIVFLPDKEANANNILMKSANLFSKATQNDVIITYLSGHGGVGYFCAYDQGLQYERLNLIINKSPARKIFIVDACHAGSWDTTSAITSKGEKLTEQQALDLFYKQLTISGNGINWLLACRPDEYSADGQNNGLFTEILLSGLKGAADKEGNDDNIITLQEIYTYLTQQFNVWNNQNRGRFWINTNVPLKMNPVLKSDGNTNIPMAVTY
ncbi:caspase family protein [Flavobacterium sp. H122]|uniref:caspase family protein n=1 Tax=Flavobacterium sp. H122 TaxID=2529860 RepID=UPI0010AA03CA|nr:caspase family protein [Flavobacterium sp. H122]